MTEHICPTCGAATVPVLPDDPEYRMCLDCLYRLRQDRREYGPTERRVWTELHGWEDSPRRMMRDRSECLTAGERNPSLR